MYNDDFTIPVSPTKRIDRMKKRKKKPNEKFVKIVA